MIRTDSKNVNINNISTAIVGVVMNAFVIILSLQATGVMQPKIDNDYLVIAIGVIVTGSIIIGYIGRSYKSYRNKLSEDSNHEKTSWKIPKLLINLIIMFIILHDL